jgi:sucrose phosphorylase
LSDTEVERLVAQTLKHGGQVSFKANADGSESPYELNITLFDALSDPADQTEAWPTKLERFVCSQAILLAPAGVPGIYIHSLFGSHSDVAGFARSGWKRDLNHERLQLKPLEARLSDPQTETAQVFRRYAHLLTVRRTQPAFHPTSSQSVVELDRQIFALRRGPRAGQVILALHNVGETSRRVNLATLASDRDLPWHDLLAGQRIDLAEHLVLEPYGVAWLSSQVPGDA